MKSSLTIVFATLLVSVVILERQVHLEINVLNVMLKGVTVVMGVMVAGLKLAMSVPADHVLQKSLVMNVEVAQVVMNLAVARLVTGVMEVTRLFSVVKIP